ncbi:helix-turn-helix domain-containing protein [Rhodoplanes elegans]|nr:AraC family transcriptional regulator [Rhodoplanes elegans]
MLDRFVIVRSSSFDEFRVGGRVFTPEVSRFEPAAREAFKGQIAAFTFGKASDSVILGSAVTSVGVLARMEPIETVRVLLPTSAAFRIQGGRWTREFAGFGRAALMPARGLDGQAGAGHFLEVRMPRSRLAGAMDLLECNAEIGAVLDRFGCDPRLDGLRLFAEHVHHLVASIDQEPAALVDFDRFRSAHEQILVLRLARVIAAAARHSRQRGPSRGGVALPRAMEFIHAHAEGDVDLAALARFAGVSLRTLQFRFRSEFDKTIVQYVRDHRLALARDRLERADPEATVTGIAVATGFSHLGEFSRLYRQRYGELPRETLQRARAGKARSWSGDRP